MNKFLKGKLFFFFWETNAYTQERRKEVSQGKLTSNKKLETSILNEIFLKWHQVEVDLEDSLECETCQNQL